MFWLRQSAELGEPVAQFNLANVVQGIGGRVEDYRKWMSLAAAQGNRDAIEALKKLDREGMKPGWRAVAKGTLHDNDARSRTPRRRPFARGDPYY